MENQKIALLLGNIEGKVDGINHRLDQLNGRVAKLQDEKASKKRLESVEKDVRSNRNMIWKISIILAGGLSGAELIKYLL